MYVYNVYFVKNVNRPTLRARRRGQTPVRPSWAWSVPADRTSTLRDLHVSNITVKFTKWLNCSALLRWYECLLNFQFCTNPRLDFLLSSTDTVIRSRVTTAFTALALRYILVPYAEMSWLFIHRFLGHLLSQVSFELLCWILPGKKSHYFYCTQM